MGFALILLPFVIVWLGVGAVKQVGTAMMLVPKMIGATAIGYILINIMFFAGSIDFTALNNIFSI